MEEVMATRVAASDHGLPERRRSEGGRKGDARHDTRHQRSTCDSATASPEFRDFDRKLKMMRLDPLVPRAEKLVLLEAIGDDKVPINSASLDNPLVVLADQALEVVAVEKQLHVCRAPRSAEHLSIDPLGFSEAGYGPITKQQGATSHYSGVTHAVTSQRGDSDA
jgi:hypothetical protein